MAFAEEYIYKAGVRRRQTTSRQLSTNNRRDPAPLVPGANNAPVLVADWSKGVSPRVGARARPGDGLIEDARTNDAVNPGTYGACRTTDKRRGSGFAGERKL